jgi:CheY-like chemotaxis protein
VVLVTAERPLRQLLCNALERWASDVRPFASVEGALKYLEKEQADVIVSDLEFPDEGLAAGVRLARSIRSQPRNRDLVLFFFTKYTREIELAGRGRANSRRFGPFGIWSATYLASVRDDLLGLGVDTSCLLDKFSYASPEAVADEIQNRLVNHHG